MPPKSNVPIRICGSKVRSGCRTCKKRHVKCDERRPICFRCERAHRECVFERPLSQDPNQTPSPDQDLRSSKPILTRHHSYPGSPSLDIIISPYGPRQAIEIAAVKSFSAYLGKELAGCFSNDVWSQIVPQVAQHEPAIWHAVVAVSTLDTTIRLGNDRHGSNVNLDVALRQYSKALQELNMQLGMSEDVCHKDVILLSCILFAIFECLQTHLQSALRHITGGMKLLMEWEACSDDQSSTNGYLYRANLLPIFLSLDTQAVQLGAVEFSDFASLPALKEQLSIPMAFATIEEAHLSLNHIFNRISRWSHWFEGRSSTESSGVLDNGWIGTECERLRTCLAEWDDASEILINLFYPEPAILLLLIQRRVLQAFFERQTDGPSEMEWDKYLPLFREAVEYAKVYMKHMEGTSQSPMSRPVFTVAMDIVLSLFLISAKCRDSQIRRQALAMLQTCNRKEGIWDSTQCAKMAEKMIEYEENNAWDNGHVPESARIYELYIRLGEDEEHGEVKPKKLVQGQDGGLRKEVVDEHLNG